MFANFIDEVSISVTSASQILESFWNVWSQAKKPFSDFLARGPGIIHYCEGYTK